jgi:hypothetical protein
MLHILRTRLSGAAGAPLIAALCALMAAPAGTSFAQEASPTPAAQAAAGAPESAPKLSMDQLESLVAPIALYPDPLLAQMLVASTYPIDVVAAQQWLDKNQSRNLQGEALEKAVEQESWDPSVQAMVSIPDALKKLAENIQWTVDLGDAFLAQQSEVMDAVQRLRAKAKDSGKLTSTEQQKVETQVVEEKTVIVVQPTNPEVVYVPSYSPSVIWGPLYYPYPPMYYPPYYGGAWLGFGVGIAIGIGIAGGWGYGCGWGGSNNININRNNNYINHYDRNNGNRGDGNRGNNNWQHNPQQRGGAAYKDRATAQKYGGTARGDASARQTQARQNQSFDRSRSGGATSGGSFDRSRSGSGGNNVGSRNFSSPSSSGRSSSAFGGSYSGSQARSSSSRGSSSMGGMRGGGGGGRRR